MRDSRWWALAVISMTQLVVVLDGTIVSIALPRAQAELGLSDGARQWVVTAYALVFGALLLIGGRVADFWGRKRAFLTGMIGFGLASTYGGLAQTGFDLILARGLQGLFAALLAPAALALLTVTFPSGRDRNLAFAVFGTLAGSGAAVGLVLGGALTEFVSWRWCLLVNIVFCALGVLGGLLFLRESRAEGDNRYDIRGTVTVSAGLGLLVYGFSLAEHGWAEWDTVLLIAAGLVLLALFARLQSRSSHPLLPLRVLAHRVRGAAFVIQALIGTLMIGGTLYLTFHLQLVMGMSPLVAGLANVVMTVVILVLTPVFAKYLPVIGPRRLMIAGPVVAAVALLLLTRITPDGGFATEILPSLILLGVGLSMLFSVAQNLALAGVAAHDAGVASAAVNSAMQIGGSIGLSVLTAVYTGASAGGSTPAALTDGYAAVFLTTAIAMLAAAVVAALLIRGRTGDLLPGFDEERVLSASL